jgi:NAD dependent epimerase/dehydratase family enzyme
VPGFLLKILFGQMAQETMLTGAKVLPEKLLEHEFEFIFTDVDLALKNILLK